MYSYKVYCVAFLLTTFLLQVTWQVSLVKHQGNNPQGVRSLGNIDGKWFFLSSPRYRSWPESKKYCTESKLQLASFTSAEQEIHVTKALHKIGLDNTLFWTAGRDAKSLSQFVWDSNPSAQICSNAKFVYSPYDTQTCIAFKAATGKPQYIADSCSHEFARALCESV